MSEWGLLDLRTMDGNHDLHHRDGELDKPEEVPDKTPEIVKSVTSFVQSIGLLPPQPQPMPDGEGNQAKAQREEEGEEEGDQEDVGASDDEAKEEKQLALRPWESRTIADWITGQKGEKSRPINRPNGGGVILRRPVTHVEAIVYAPAGDWLAIDTFSCPPLERCVLIFRCFFRAHLLFHSFLLVCPQLLYYTVVAMVFDDLPPTHLHAFSLPGNGRGFEERRGWIEGEVRGKLVQVRLLPHGVTYA
jgi:hypothetical protein